MDILGQHMGDVRIREKVIHRGNGVASQPQIDFGENNKFYLGFSHRGEHPPEIRTKTFEGVVSGKRGETFSYLSS